MLWLEWVSIPARMKTGRKGKHRTAPMATTHENCKDTAPPYSKDRWLVEAGNLLQRGKSKGLGSEDIHGEPDSLPSHSLVMLRVMAARIIM